jgi:hypothetical protein
MAKKVAKETTEEQLIETPEVEATEQNEEVAQESVTAGEQGHHSRDLTERK